MKRKGETPQFERMTPAQLARATAEFDREMVIEEFRPLTPRERTRWEKARQKLGRPRKGQGAKVVSVSVERGLLARSDALAHKLGIPRAALIERGLKAVLAAASQA